MHLLQRVAATLALAVVAGLGSGCSAPASLLLMAVEQGATSEKDPTCMTPGCAAAAVLQHAYAKFTEGDPTPCVRLNSVARALTARCGPYTPGSLLTQDVAASGLPLCPLSLAARDPRLWPVLPELLAQGATPETCEQPPLAALAQAQPCPDFTSASPEALNALRWLAEADTRAVQHDVVRLLSCPAAQAAGLSAVLDDWLAQGLLPWHGLSFSVLGALDPSALGSPLSRALEAHGHIADTALSAYVGALPAGFDLALRRADAVALNWWFDRLPGLVNRVPAQRPNQLPWLPLARVITPGYLLDATAQGPLVAQLIARGADPWRRLPHEPAQSVVAYARLLNSAALPALDTPLIYPAPFGERAAALAPGVVGAGAGLAAPGLRPPR
jgi:hypothetical protein